MQHLHPECDTKALKEKEKEKERLGLWGVHGAGERKILKRMANSKNTK